MAAGSSALTFNQGEELFVFDSVALHVDFQRQQQGEQELVLLIQTPGRIIVHLVSHVVDDFADPFACDGTL